MADIVICGGGVIGASILYHLTEKGQKPLMIERNEIACGASGKAGGFLARTWCDRGPLGPLARESFDMHGQLAEKLGVDYGYRRLDTLSVESNLHKKTPHSPHGDLPDWLDSNVSKFSPLGNNTNTAQVHPEKFTHALVDSAHKSGASVLIGIVEGIEWDKSGSIPKVTGVFVNENGEKKVIKTTKAVVAMGPWSKWLLGWLPNPSNKGYHDMLNITAVRAHSILMHPEDPVSAHALFLSYTDSEGSFSDPEIYPRPDGEVYMCGVAHPYSVPIDPKDVEVDDAATETLHGIVGSLSSRLKGTKVDKLQACCLPCSHDDTPLIGAIPGVSGLYIATGHSCWGILNSPATGAALAELIVDGKASVVDLAPFDPARFMQ